jgi:hypothetical protein
MTYIYGLFPKYFYATLFQSGGQIYIVYKRVEITYFQAHVWFGGRVAYCLGQQPVTGHAVL